MAPRNPDICLGPVHNSFPEALNEAATNEVTAVHTPQVKRPPMEIVWKNVIIMGGLHVGALYGLYLTLYSHPYTLLFSLLLYNLSCLGITAGAHRLWSHRTYTARLPLRIFLAICNSSAVENDIIEWSRDHRVHHKYSETDADPHNAKRGFFFAHVGWLLTRKHPEVKAKGQGIDVSDLLADPVCRIQRRFYIESAILFCFVLPTVIPWYFWGESLLNAYFVAGVFRYIAVLNVTWCVNSVAHMFGNKPYDKRINPVENLMVVICAIGEGFHNYHHAFPVDYKASEFPFFINLTTMFINAMAFIGQAYNLKEVTPEVYKKRQEKRGDGTTGFNMIGSSEKSSPEVFKEHTS